MFSFLKRSKNLSPELLDSKLFDEKSFYNTFIQDLHATKKEVIIESPFITVQRANTLIPIFRKLLGRDIKIYVITRAPSEHDLILKQQSEKIISIFETFGVQVFLCVGNHHRKLAILDRQIIWEGSLNILSQTHSREIMRRIHSKVLALETFHFLRFEKYI